MKKKRSHKRADGQTQLTASIPKPLKESLKNLAAAERRSLSNWLVIELEKLVEQKTAGKIVGMPAPGGELVGRAAEAEGEYPAKKGKC
jgi:hypothetical protein